VSQERLTSRTVLMHAIARRVPAVGHATRKRRVRATAAASSPATRTAMVRSMSTWPLARTHGYAAVLPTTAWHRAHPMAAGAVICRRVMQWVHENRPRSRRQAVRRWPGVSRPGASHVASWFFDEARVAARRPLSTRCCCQRVLRAEARCRRDPRAIFGEDTALYPERAPVHARAGDASAAPFSRRELDPAGSPQHTPSPWHARSRSANRTKPGVPLLPRPTTIVSTCRAWVHPRAMRP